MREAANELLECVEQKGVVDEPLRRTEHELLKLLRHIQELPFVTVGSGVDSTPEQIETVRKKLLCELRGFEFNAGKTLDTLLLMVREPEFHAKLQEVKLLLIP